ncbi:MAG: crossover junction endodeoxyribonuclease RuvC [Planctomycetaceae bacterium]|nr:crossover junction endodeoxyribonuclease RuvC [Planctomycetaceae bacterium]
MGFATGNAFAGVAPDLCLGIDPGLRRTGYALIQRTISGPTLLEGGVVSSTKSLTLAERVHEIGQGITEIISEFRPESVAIEQVFSHGQNPKTALLMAHARGAILYASASAGLTVIHYTPRQIKKLLTGSGRASKDQIQHAVKHELQLKRLLEPNDVADACAIALCHYHSLSLAKFTDSAPQMAAS